MANLFRAYGVRDVKIPTYLIESSAPINVDDPSFAGTRARTIDANRRDNGD
jgi:hypothetical protein